MIERMMDDIFILKQIRKGNADAFKYVFDAYFIPLSRSVYIYVKDEDLAQEIALDTFTAFWERREEIVIQITIKAYLFQAARNRAFNYLRDNDRFVSVDDFSFMEYSEEDKTVEIKELERLLTDAVCTLPEKCRHVFHKSRMENLSNKEIAEELNISVKGVEAQITRALKYIQRYLGDAYHYLW